MKDLQKKGSRQVMYSSFVSHNIIYVPLLKCLRQVELLRRKERNEAHLYMMVEVYLEDDFQCHQSTDLLDFEDVKPRYGPA